MNAHGFREKQIRPSQTDIAMQYLVMPSEPKEVIAAGRGSFGFRNRYLAKRRVLHTIKRMRRTQNT